MLGAVRDLASQVATYAGGKSVAATRGRRSGDGGRGGDRRHAATTAARSTSGSPRSPECLEVFITCPHAPTLAATHLSRGPGCRWTGVAEGAQLVCHIRQAMA